MATFIPQVQDRSAPIPQLPTNYQFLQTQMDRANAMYESGFQEVKSGYASILSTPVTGVEANERKNKYIQDAQNKLRTLSSKDLSLPQNVVQAEAAYAPFWEDDILIQNTAETRRQIKGNGQLDSWLYSTDEDVRAMYSDTNREAFQIANNLLANTPMTKEAYAKIMPELQKVRAIPYYDINKDAEESWKNQFGTGIDKGIGTVHLGGGAMVTEFNGPNSYQAYKTWYTSQMLSDPKYAPQLRQQAWVELQNRRDEVVRNNPDVAPEQVDKLLAKGRMKELQDIYQKKVGDYSTLIKDYSDRLNDLNLRIKVDQKGEADPSQIAEGDMLTYKLQQYIVLRDGVVIEGNKYSETVNGKPNDRYLQTITDIATNPLGYLTNINVDRMASIWAEGRASVTQQKIEVDPIKDKAREWHDKDRKYALDLQRLLKEKDELNLRKQELAETARGHDLDFIAKTKKNPYTFAPMLGWAGNTPNLSGNISEETIQVDHLQKYLKIQEGINIPLFEANKELLDIKNPTGFGTIVLGDNGMGFTDAEMSTFSQYMDAMIANGEVPPDAKQKAVWDKAKNILVKQGIVKSAEDIKGPLGMRNALLEYSGRVSDALSTKSSYGLQAAGYELAKARQRIDGNIRNYDNTKAAFDKDVAEHIAKDDRYRSLRIIENGKTRMVDKGDIQSIIPPIQAIDANGRKVTLQPEDMAEAYMLDNDFSVKALGPDNPVLVKLNGVDYRLAPPTDMSVQKFMDGLQTIKNRFGTAKEFNTLRTKAVSELASTRGYKDGALYKVVNMDPNDPDKEKAQFIKDKIKQLAPISNTTSMYYFKPGEDAPTALLDANKGRLWNGHEGDEAVQQVRNILSSDPEIEKYVASVHFIRDLGEAAVTFKDDFSTKPMPLAGRTVYLKYTPTAREKLNSWLPSNTVGGPLAQVEQGEAYTTPTTLERDKYVATITPINMGPDGKPTSVVVNKKYIQDGIVRTTRIPQDLVGPYAKSLSEIYSTLQQDMAATYANYLTDSAVNAQKIAAGIKK